MRLISLETLDLDCSLISLGMGMRSGVLEIITSGQVQDLMRKRLAC